MTDKKNAQETRELAALRRLHLAARFFMHVAESDTATAALPRRMRVAFDAVRESLIDLGDMPVKP